MSQLVDIQAKDGIWTVRLNRPDVRNAFSIELMRSLTQAAERLRDEAGVRAVVLTAAGEHFSAGMDLKDPKSWDPGKQSLAERRSLASTGERMCQAWENIPALTLCAIEGHCIGGGAALAVATDLRVIGASAWFWLPEIAIGIPLGWGALPRLVRLLGPAKAKRFIILCDRFAGREAVDFGLAEYLVADGQAYAEAPPPTRSTILPRSWRATRWHSRPGARKPSRRAPDSPRENRASDEAARHRRLTNRGRFTGTSLRSARRISSRPVYV